MSDEDLEREKQRLLKLLSGAEGTEKKLTRKRKSE